MTEQWAVIAEFPTYEVSNLGRVRRGGRVKTLRTDHNGYTSAVLWHDSVSHTRLLGPLVAIAFIGPRPDGASAMAREYGVSSQVMARALNGTNWGPL